MSSAPRHVSLKPLRTTAPSVDVVDADTAAVRSPPSSPSSSSSDGGANSPTSRSVNLIPTTPASPTSPISPRTQPTLPRLEICVDSIHSAVAAATAGADRIELCTALVDGGTTPSYGLISEVVSAVSVPVHVLIRPRCGDFAYDGDELSIMRSDIVTCKLLGVSGVVVGALTSDGRVDAKTLQQLMSAARPMSVTFHRAIDMTRDAHLIDNLDALIHIGVDRVLTSGLANDVIAGKATIKRMVNHCRERGVVIMAGGGVTAANIQQLVAETGVNEVHASARSLKWGAMAFKKNHVYLGGEKHNSGLEAEYAVKTVDGNIVAAMRNGMRLGASAANNNVDSNHSHSLHRRHTSADIDETDERNQRKKRDKP